MVNTVIKNDVNLAHAKATALQTAVSDVLAFQSVTQDTQTTVQGNVKAHEAIGKEDSLGKEIALAVKSASKNLQSVAVEFEALDKKLGQTLFKPNFDLLGDLR
ncbi:hypothetical protein FACS1894192_03820 [Bacilli bacterium]|nr:hypothetical protein FACS1894192_03820 [Bacilli bacterium]